MTNDKHDYKAAVRHNDKARQEIMAHIQQGTGRFSQEDLDVQIAIQSALCKAHKYDKIKERLEQPSTSMVKAAIDASNTFGDDEILAQNILYGASITFKAMAAKLMEEIEDDKEC